MASRPTSRQPRAPFELTVTGRAGGAYVAMLQRMLPRARQHVRCPLAQMTVILVGDALMSRLHDQFMQIPTPTDVLTFPLDVDACGRASEGEVYVCVPYARRQARLRHGNIEHEVLLYALHGMLHLAGFDDRTDREFGAMHRKEDQILTALGIGPVFAPKPAAASSVSRSTAAGRVATRAGSGRASARGRR